MRRPIVIAFCCIAPLMATAAGAEPADSIGTNEQIEAVMRPLMMRFAETVDHLSAYQVVLTKQQRIGGDLKPVETVLLKHRREPECRYMRWLQPPHQGREVLYCPDSNKGKMKVHEPGLLGLKLSVDPNGSLARSGNLRPLQDSGLFNMLNKLRADVANRDRAATGAAAAAAATMQLSHRVVQGQASTCVLRHNATPAMDVYPVGAREFCFSDAGLPTEVRFWNEKGELMEHYTFGEYQLDPPFTEQDFSVDNPDYGF